MAITITARPCPDTDLEINGTPEGSFTAGSTIDLQLTDGVNPVTPVSVGRVGDTVTATLPAASALEPETEAYIIANTALTSSGNITAVDTFFKGLKTNNLRNKMRAIYLFRWSSASNNKWNIIDPRDANDAFRLTFFGGLTHNTTGIDPNGTNGYAETYLYPNWFGTSDIHVSVFSNENTHTGSGDNNDIGTVTGANNRFWLSAGLTNTNSPTSGLGGTLAATTGAADGFFIGTLTGVGVINNTNTLYKNGSSIASSTSTMQVTNNNSIHIFKWNGVAGGFSNRELSFASIGHGLNATEAAAFNTLVQNLLTSIT
jgi:hypothetical protein